MDIKNIYDFKYSRYMDVYFHLPDRSISVPTSRGLRQSQHVASLCCVGTRESHQSGSCSSSQSTQTVRGNHNMRNRAYLHAGVRFITHKYIYMCMLVCICQGHVKKTHRYFGALDYLSKSHLLRRCVALFQ